MNQNYNSTLSDDRLTAESLALGLGLVFGLWALGRGTWDWDWDLGSETKSGQVKSMSRRVGSISVLGSVQLDIFYFFACFLHFFLHQFRRSLSSAMWGKNMAATKSSDERKLLRRKELAETRQRSLWGNTKGSGRSVGRVATVLGKVTPAKGRVNGGQI